MATQGGRPDAPLTSVLFDEPYRFDFFQAVRIFERVFRDRKPVGRPRVAPAEEVVRFRTRQTLEFPASQLHEIARPPESESPQPPSQLFVNFMGATGPLGVLPTHYTLLLIERAREKDTKLWEFLDLFNHRMISLFYRAWEKYRFPFAYERGDDDFTEYLFCLIGLGTRGLRGRLDPAHLIQRVSVQGDGVKVIDNVPSEQARAIFEQEVQKPKEAEIADIKRKAEQDSDYTPSDEELELIRDWVGRPEIYLDEANLRRIYQFPQGTLWDFFLHAANVKKIRRLGRADQGLLYYSGLIAQRPRSAYAVGATLGDRFGVPARVRAFTGQWLKIEEDSLTRLGRANSLLGVSTIAGARVWDTQSKFRVRFGPLTLAQFRRLIPSGEDYAAAQRLARFLVGVEFDFDFQLVLRAAEVPPAVLTTRARRRPQLGWTTWLKTQPFKQDDSQVVLSAS